MNELFPSFFLNGKWEKRVNNNGFGWWKGGIEDGLALSHGIIVLRGQNTVTDSILLPFCPFKVTTDPAQANHPNRPPIHFDGTQKNAINKKERIFLLALSKKYSKFNIPFH